MDFNFDKLKKSDTPFLILEIGVNYFDIAQKEKISPLEAAKLMIDKAKEYGGDCVKFQSYKASKLASRNSPSYWDLTKEPTGSQFELFKKFDKFGASEYEDLAQYCQQKGIVFSSTPFDFEAVDYLYDLVPFYKISSSDLTNIPFIQYIARKKKPVLISTGAATIGEIDEAVSAVKKEGCSNIALLHCVLDYPTDYANINLNMIKHLKSIYPDHVIGFSDHTVPDPCMLVITTAYLLGARIIEKHFTLDKTIPGNDHYHSLDGQDLKRFVSNMNLLKQIKGEFYKRPLECEIVSRRNARRSIVAKLNMKKGDILSEERLSFKRPGTGISPKYLDLVTGKKLLKDINEDEILTWDHI